MGKTKDERDMESIEYRIEIEREQVKNRQDAFKQRKAEEGLKKCTLWIPDTPEAFEKMKKYAAKLRKDHAKQA